MHCTEVESPKAKKPHLCDSCGQRIEPGEQYKRWRCYDGGDAGTCKMHPECLAWHQANDDGYGWEFERFGYDRPATQPQPGDSGRGDGGGRPNADVTGLAPEGDKS